MVEFTIIGFLIGVALALHFKMFVLVPVMPSTLVVVTIGELLRGETIWWIAVAWVLVAISVQFGYFIGRILQLGLDEKAREIKLRTRPTT
jgi:hypothetical protein